MGSLRYGGVLISAYPDDHQPRHVHEFFGGIEVVMDLGLDRSVTIADRRKAIKPGDASRNDIRKILDTAAANFDDLVKLWEAMHV